MHALGWSQEKAVEYMLTHSAATLDNIKGEVHLFFYTLKGNVDETTSDSPLKELNS